MTTGSFMKKRKSYSQSNQWRKRAKFIFKAIGVLGVAFYFISISSNPVKTEETTESQNISGEFLFNGNFESAPSEMPPQPWSLKNKEIAKYRLEKIGDSSKGFSFFIRLRKTSDYEKTFVISQAIDVRVLRGKEIPFGGEIKTKGAKVLIRMWTPEGDSVLKITKAGKFKKFSKNFKVPDTASFLAFGIEIVGKKGDEVWLDNLFVGEKKVGKKSTGAKNLITIDISKKMGKISPLKFGGHMEWIMSGHGVWDVKKGVLNQEIIKLLLPLKIPIWRFPGGIYSDYYNWKDGINDRSKRKFGIDPFDQKTKHKHDFGTDEFINFLRKTNAEALITVNLGTGNLNMATSWLTYFKSKKVNVRYWEIGNEIYMADPDDSNNANGSRIYHTAKDYTSKFIQIADAMKAIDPGIMIGAIGGINNTHESNKKWMDILLKGAGEKIDFLALHNAFAPIIFDKYDYTSEKNRKRAYRAMLAYIEEFKADTALIKNKIRRYVPGKADKIKIAITEHYPIFGQDSLKGGEKQLRENIDQTRTFASTLFTASFLTAIINDPQIIMANYLNPIQDYYGGLLNRSSEGIIKNPIYYVYWMFRNYFGSELVFSKFEGATFSSPALGMVPAISNSSVLEVAAAIEKDGVISVSIVNKDLNKPQVVKIKILGKDADVKGEMFTLNAPFLNAVTVPPISKSTRRVRSLNVEKKIIEAQKELTLVIPAHSFNILQLR